MCPLSKLNVRLNQYVDEHAKEGYRIEMITPYRLNVINTHNVQPGHIQIQGRYFSSFIGTDMSLISKAEVPDKLLHRVKL